MEHATAHDPKRAAVSLTLASCGHSDFTLRKSRFVGCVQPMADRPGALVRVAELRALHPGATHVCWALLAGGHSAAVDDGEPSGTAGRPMLEVLRHHDLEGVLATAVRTFGGVKLGAGGLVRAYTDCVVQALSNATTTPIQRLAHLQCSLPYALEGAVRRELAAHHAALVSVEHGSLVQMELELPEINALAFQQALTDLSSGAIGWT